MSACFADANSESRKRRYDSSGRSREGHTRQSHREKQNPLWRPLKPREKPKEEEEIQKHSSNRVSHIFEQKFWAHRDLVGERKGEKISFECRPT